MSDLKIYSVSEDASEEQEIRPSYVVESLTTSPQEILKQRVIKCLMSSSGSDAFQNLSVGLDQLSGTSVAKGAMSSEVLSRIRSAEERLIQVQRADEPLGSALSHIEILGLRQESIDSVRVMIEIYSQSGEAISAEFTG
ncbi:MAG: hypothetical protein VXZ72_04825 [Chlamydiota bacterium]|nr:hypothetical protein [Chlamydiota bacterium]